LTEELRSGEVEGGGGEDSPGEASESEGDNVAAIGLRLGNKVQEKGDSGETHQGCDGGAADLAAVRAGIGAA
jgi:hypothetical protein